MPTTSENETERLMADADIINTKCSRKLKMQVVHLHPLNDALQNLDWGNYVKSNPWHFYVKLLWHGLNKTSPYKQKRNKKTFEV